MFLIRLVNTVFEILWWLLAARFLLSWLPNLDRAASCSGMAAALNGSPC